MGRVDTELNRIPMTWSGLASEGRKRKGKAGEGAASSGGGEEKNTKKSANFCKCLLSTCVWT